MATNKTNDNSQAVDSGDDANTPQRYDGVIGNAPAAQDSPAQGSQAQGSTAIDSHDDPDEQRAMVTALLDVTFEENVQLHAENLAEKLIERQAELDRRELHLNRISLEIENQMRQSRLEELNVAESDSEETISDDIAAPSEAVAEADAAIESVDEESPSDGNDSKQSKSEELLFYRVDRYISAQRAPSSKLSLRMRKYLAKKKWRKTPSSDKQPAKEIAKATATAEQADSSIKTADDSSTEPRLESIPPINTTIVESLRTESTEDVTPDPVLLSINNLTQSASAIRQRGEEVDAMYEQLTDVFSEMLRQQAAMRQLASQLSNSASGKSAVLVQTVHNEIDRLTIQLTLVGREHFLLPAESEEVA